MFNKKKVKPLEKEIIQLRSAIEVYGKLTAEFKYSTFGIRQEITSLKYIVAPGKIVTYQEDAIEFAKTLLKYKSGGGCQNGRCRPQYYAVPLSVIDNVANIKVSE